MPRIARTALLSLAALAALAVGGCGNKTEKVTVAETEGIYVSVDDLTYQVQISRILNPASVEDAAYLKGLPEGEELAADEVWFGVFMRVENETDEELTPIDGFKITDTQDTVFEPVELDPELNLYVYEPRPLAPGELMPVLNSPASDNTIRGELILFKLKVESLGNRPLELELESAKGGDNGVCNLDV